MDNQTAPGKLVLNKLPTSEEPNRVFSVRISNELVLKLDKAVFQLNASRNYLIEQLLRFGLEHLEIL